jgi:hypothetical protein
VSRHKDAGALTILLQDDVGGLEVRRKDGEWISVQPDSQALVINVGDVIQVGPLYLHESLYDLYYMWLLNRVDKQRNVARISLMPLFNNVGLNLLH